MTTFTDDDKKLIKEIKERISSQRAYQQPGGSRRY